MTADEPPTDGGPITSNDGPPPDSAAPQTPPPFVWETPEAAATAQGTTAGAPAGRPMTSGDIFERAVWIYRTGFLVLVAVAAVIQIPIAVVDAFLGQRIADAFAPLTSLGAQPTADDVTSILQNALPAAVPALLTIIAVSFLAGLLLSPALIATAGRIHAGEPSSVGDAYRNALRAAPAIFVGSLVQALGLASLFIAIVVVGALLDSAGLRGTIVIGFLIAFVAVAYVTIRLAVWPQVVVLERRDPLDALVRSWRLVKGAMWRTVGILFVTAIATAVAGAVLGTLGGIVGRALPSGWASIVGDVLAVLTVSWGPIVTTLLFLDLRARREGPAAATTIPPEASWPIVPR
jgi:hypothetical protein